MKFRSSSVRVALLLLAGSGLLSGQTISDFNPKYGAPGDKVTINGSGFLTGTIKVFFENDVQANVFVNGDTILTITNVPNGITTGPIKVQRNSMTPVQSAEDFNVIGTGPFIASFSPTFGAFNDLITIHGVHFKNASAVKFTNILSHDWTVVDVDGTIITARVPAAATNGFISVTTPQGTSNSPAPFTVIGPGPYVTNFSPFAGGPGTLVEIRGVHFVNGGQVTSVTFSNVPGTGLNVISDSRLQITAPNTVRTGPLTISSPLGAFTTSSNFFVPPFITSFSPPTGRTDTNVLIVGTNFLGTTAVRFNGIHATSFSVSNNTALYAHVPTNATTGPIRVDTPGPFSFITATNFVVLPTIYGFTPGSGPVGTSVTVTGANFNVGTPTVKFGGVTAGTPTGVTFGSLTAVVPNGATNGLITVTTTHGSHTSASLFHLPAVITSFTPGSGGGGTVVRINGTNFLGAGGVAFDGVAAADFTVTNNTTIGAVAPPGVTTGPITVTTPANTASSGAQLFHAPAQIVSFDPGSGLPGQLVMLSGVNFTGATAVRFNSLTASNYTVINDALIHAWVPTNATTGPISVTTPAGTVESATDFVVAYASDLALLGSDAPDPVVIGTSLIYTLRVTNSGPVTAPGVFVTNTLPPSVALVSATTSVGSLTTNASQVIASLGLVPMGASPTITIGVIPQSAGNITNVSVVVSGYPDPIGADNTNRLTTLVVPLPVLSIAPYTATQVKLSWPVVLSNFNLQFSAGLSTNHAWTNVGVPPLTVGEEKVIIEPSTEPAKYYRLKGQ